MANLIAVVGQSGQLFKITWVAIFICKNQKIVLYLYVKISLTLKHTNYEKKI